MQPYSSKYSIFIISIVAGLVFPSAQTSRLDKRPFAPNNYNPITDNEVGRNLLSPQQCVVSFGRPVVTDCLALINFMETGDDPTIYQSLLTDSARQASGSVGDNELAPPDGQAGGDYISLPRVYSYSESYSHHPNFINSSSSPQAQPSAQKTNLSPSIQKAVASASTPSPAPTTATT